MEIDFNDSKSIGKALEERGEGYVALELARDNCRTITKLANEQAKFVKAANRALFAYACAIGALAVLSITLFFR